jgi:MSHA biogenesis protein MshP
MRAAPGFAYIAAIVLLLVVAGLALSMVRLSTTQQGTASQTMLVARASQAARGGTEWMFYRLGVLAKAGTPGCPNSGAAQTLSDFKPSGFLVTVSCSYQSFNEGEDLSTGNSITKTIFTVKAVACNGSGATCPDDTSAARPDYTERRRVATVCVQADGSDCY